MSNVSVPFTQLSNFTQNFTRSNTQESGYNKQNTSFYKTGIFLNNKIGSLTARSGFWSNSSAIKTAVDSYMPTMSQFDNLEKLNLSTIKNTKNLKEEMKKAIYTAEKFDDVEDQL
jgi:hypothetical protein